MLANVEPMVRLGLVRTLAEDQIDVLGHELDDDGVVLTARQACPDAIVLGSDELGSADLAERLRAAVPAVKLIFFLRDEHGLNVLDPRAASPRRMRAPISEVLLAELAPTRPHPEE